jgi:orotidine-5'-phosphate decarboxylase
MKFIHRLRQAWSAQQTLLCVGLDPDPARLPRHLAAVAHPVFEFGRAIVDATADLVCAFKPQIAYYAAARAEDQLEMTIAHIRRHHPAIPVILDAKRGDVGSTAEMYAREAFERVYFEHLLTREHGSMSRVAERSGLERTHLYRKLKALGLPVGRREE